MSEYLVTSESVTEGHPDKICDQIADGILDSYLSSDPNSRVAIETMISKNTIMIAGEVTSKAKVDAAETARTIVKNIGYTDISKGFDYKTCVVLTNINTQSPDIAQGVNRDKIFGAGDQGMMYGYATDETRNYMPLTIDLANKLTMKLSEVRKNNKIPWLNPDGKSQVTMKYNSNGEPLYITNIIVSAQHDKNVSRDELYNTILKEVIYSTVDKRWINEDTQIYINPTGRFVVGGPLADTGVTGRKIMVDTYGGVGKHGGGAFSGKDPTKVDRSAAYMARYAAKNIVAAKLAKKCEIELAYSIGIDKPLAITINTFNTEKIRLDIIYEIVNKVFSFSVIDILEQLNLRKPQYLKTAVYGHFGRENQNFQWENADKVLEIRKEALKLLGENLNS